VREVLHWVKEIVPEVTAQGNRSLEGRGEGLREALFACDSSSGYMCSPLIQLDL